MKIEETFEVAVPVETMYYEMNRIDDIGWCVAGVKQVEAVDDDHSKWKIEARAGFMARTFELDATILERRPPDRIVFTGRGQDLEMGGHLDLRPAGPNRTQCHIEVDVTVTGPFASIVDLMAKGPQQQLIRQTIANLRKRFETRASSAAPAAF